MSVARHELHQRALLPQQALALLITEKCDLEARIQIEHFDRRRSLRLDLVQQAIECTQALFRAYEE